MGNKHFGRKDMQSNIDNYFIGIWVNLIGIRIGVIYEILSHNLLSIKEIYWMLGLVILFLANKCISKDIKILLILIFLR